MFGARSVTPRDAGAHVIALIDDSAPVRRIWVDSDINGFDVYLLTDPLEPGAERQLLEIGPALRQRCPTAVINLRLINPARWDVSHEDLAQAAVPPGAREIIWNDSE